MCPTFVVPDDTTTVLANAGAYYGAPIWRIKIIIFLIRPYRYAQWMNNDRSSVIWLHFFKQSLTYYFHCVCSIWSRNIEWHHLASKYCSVIGRLSSSLCRSAVSGIQTAILQDVNVFNQLRHSSMLLVTTFLVFHCITQGIHGHLFRNSNS